MTSTLINIAKSPIARTLAVGATTAFVGLVAGKTIKEGKFSFPNSSPDAFTLLAGTAISTGLAGAFGLSLAVTGGMGATIGGIGGYCFGEKKSDNNNDDGDDNSVGSAGNPTTTNDIQTPKNVSDTSNNDTNNNNNNTAKKETLVNNTLTEHIHQEKNISPVIPKEILSSSTKLNNSIVQSEGGGVEESKSIGNDDTSVLSYETDMSQKYSSNDIEEVNKHDISTLVDDLNLSDTESSKHSVSTEQQVSVVPTVSQTSDNTQKFAQADRENLQKSLDLFAKERAEKRRDNTEKTATTPTVTAKKNNGILRTIVRTLRLKKKQATPQTLTDFVTTHSHASVATKTENAIKNLSISDDDLKNAFKALQANNQFKETTETLNTQLNPRSNGKERTDFTATNKTKIQEFLKSFKENNNTEKSNEYKIAEVILNTMNEALLKKVAEKKSNG